MALVATKPITVIREQGLMPNCRDEMAKIQEAVRSSAQKIMEAKRATHYGIGMATVRIERAIFGSTFII